MSFARFSSDKWMSDVYIYTNSGDNLISVHVAGNRFVFDDNGKSSREFIDDEFAGQSHHGLTISEAVEFMHTLSARGYHVPDKVIPALKENRHEVAWSPAELPGGVSAWEVEEAETKALLASWKASSSARTPPREHRKRAEHEPG